jgi:hypothetical protein
MNIRSKSWRVWWGEIEEFSQRAQLMLNTRATCFTRNGNQSSRSRHLKNAEIVSHKTVETFRRVFARYGGLIFDKHYGSKFAAFWHSAGAGCGRFAAFIPYAWDREAGSAPVGNPCRECFTVGGPNAMA